MPVQFIPLRSISDPRYLEGDRTPRMLNAAEGERENRKHRVRTKYSSGNLVKLETTRHNIKHEDIMEK